MPVESLNAQLQKESWETIAAMLESIKIDVGRGKCCQKLERQMRLLKQVLREQLLSFNGTESIDASLLIGTIKSISRINSELEAKGIKNNEFMMFMGIVLDKLKAQKLRASKPMEMRKEFFKMKGVIENDSL